MSSRFAQLVERAAREAIPLDVALELTAGCNFSCVHCYVAERPAPVRADGVPTARLLRLLEELAALGTLRLALTGGELLLRRDWAEIAARARQLGFALRLLTNASLVTEEAARTIGSLGAAVDASLYSLDPAVFEGITGVPGSLRRTLDGVERLRARGVEVRLKVPLLRGALDGLEAVFAYGERVGAACLPSPMIMARRGGDPAPLGLRAEREALARFLGSPRFAFTEPDREAWKGRSDLPLCGAGTRLAVVTASGDVLACPDLATSAGSILEKPFAEIWRDSPWLERLRALRRRDLETCGSCERLRYCSRCPALALDEDGSLTGPSRWACQHAELLEELGLVSAQLLPTRPVGDSSR